MSGGELTAGFQLERLGEIMEPDPGNPQEAEGDIAEAIAFLISGDGVPHFRDRCQGASSAGTRL